MKINNKILKIPPYICTSWKNVESLFLEQENLIILLRDRSKIKIPNLDKKIITDIFDAHDNSLDYDENKIETKTTPNKPFPSTGGGISLDFPLGASGLEALGSAMQHNPKQANSPNLPIEVLKKIAAISNVLGDEATSSIPKPESHCNCVHCQIARALHNISPLSKEDLENTDEEVTEEDLRFKLWDIKQIGEKLYTVTNPLDSNEQYQVFLGEPLGCTCGEKKCEHIRAVLNS
jgi:hypothetical protein